MPVREPNSTTPTKIALVVKKGQPITVGYPSPSSLFDSFKDPKVFGSEFNDLPGKFEYPYRARSWETAKFGFGEILHNGVLVAAMFHEDHLPQSRVDEIVQAHKDQMDGLLPDLITGKRVTYWFWRIDHQVLMICAYQKDQKGFQLTAAMGDEVVLDALGISPAQANTDVARIDAPVIKVDTVSPVAIKPSS